MNGAVSPRFQLKFSLTFGSTFSKIDKALLSGTLRNHSWHLFFFKDYRPLRGIARPYLIFLYSKQGYSMSCSTSFPSQEISIYNIFQLFLNGTPMVLREPELGLKWIVSLKHLDSNQKIQNLWS